MRGVRKVAAGAVLAVVAGVPIIVSSAQAVGTAVTGSFICEQRVSVGGVAATVSGEPVTLTYSIAVPASHDLATPATASFTLDAGSVPVPKSPAVELEGVTLATVGVELDVFTTTVNSPSAITGEPQPAPHTVTAPVLTALLPNKLLPSSPWGVELTAVPVDLPLGQAGDRQWLRLKSLTYNWSSTDLEAPVTGSTFCRLVAPVPTLYSTATATSTTTVEQPLFGFLADSGAPTSRQHLESYTNFQALTAPSIFTAAATFSSFAARVTLTGSAAPPVSDDTCTVTNPSGCKTGQQVTATVVAGSLSQQATGVSSNPSSTAITMRKQSAASIGSYGGAASITVSTADQVMEGALNPVTVTDVRGGTAGWSLTAELSGPFTEVGSGSIATNRAKLIAVGCEPVTGSATRTTGTGGVLGSAVTLCGVDPGVDDSDGQSGGGQYVVTGRVELDVPAFQKAGEYTSTLVVTLT